MLEVKGITKAFGNISVLTNLSFSVNKGESLVILGPSGSGKTTLLRLIAGLDMPSEGEIHINGRLASSPEYSVPPYKRGLGFVFQTPALWPHMTVEQNILFGMRDRNKMNRIERANWLMEAMRIKHIGKRYPGQISGGEARRVSIARAIAPEPLCILMDEPLTNLDRELKESILCILLSVIKKSETSVVYVTHDEDEACSISKNSLRLTAKRWCEGNE